MTTLVILMTLGVQSPTVITRIDSPACASVTVTGVNEALASGCYRPTPPVQADDADPKQREERQRAIDAEFRTRHLIWQTAQVTNRGHYAPRSINSSEIEASAKLLSPPRSSSGTSWSGSGSKDTETFVMTAGEWRIVWEASSTSRVGGLLSVMVYNDAGRMVSSMSSGDIKGRASDTSHVRVPPGRYYLSINSANATWRVSVEP